MSGGFDGFRRSGRHPAAIAVAAAVQKDASRNGFTDGSAFLLHDGDDLIMEPPQGIEKFPFPEGTYSPAKDRFLSARNRIDAECHMSSVSTISRIFSDSSSMLNGFWIKDVPRLKISSIPIVSGEYPDMYRTFNPGRASLR